MKNSQLVLSEVIEKRILLLRGQKVMLDKDLAELYRVKPIRLREQVKRNLTRFPEDFMFQLNEEKTDWLLSQSAIPSRKYLGGYNPYVFTEQGIERTQKYSTLDHFQNQKPKGFLMPTPLFEIKIHKAFSSRLD